MKNWLKNALIHWQTTLGGFLAGLIPAAMIAYQTGQFELTWKSFVVWLIFVYWGGSMKDANKSNALNPQPAAVVKAIAIIFLLLTCTGSLHAQMYSTSKILDAKGLTKTKITSGATVPDTILLQAGQGVPFDSITAPFLVEIDSFNVQYIGGVAVPVASSCREVFSVSYVSGDTLVLSARSLYGTLARTWPSYSNIRTSLSPGLTKQNQDSIAYLKDSIISIGIDLAADTATTIQTLLGSPMKQAVGASQTWLFAFYLSVTSSSSAGLEIALSFPSGATVLGQVIASTTGATAFTTDQISATATAGTALCTVNGSGLIWVQGTIKTGTTAGTLLLQFLKVTSGTATIKAHSKMTMKRIQ